MIINEQGLSNLFNAFKIAFQMGIYGAPSKWNEVAMKVPSATRQETYAWLAAIPRIREWIGERQVNNLALRGYAIVNRDFEMTIKVPRNTIEDDQFGVFSPMMQQMGHEVALHPDTLIFGLLAAGFAAICFDGQPFFSATHPVGDGAMFPVTEVSNVQTGDGPAWYLLDCSQPVRPLIFQDRKPFDFVHLVDPQMGGPVFWRNEFVYGVNGRSNAGYGLWQLAYASTAPLTSENYAAARAAMQSQVSDSGRPLGVSPTHLVFPPSLEQDARRLLVSALTQQTLTTVTTGGDVTTSAAVTNEWAGSAKMLMTPYLLPSVLAEV